jgi:ubiquinone/menaquinone biosynthesis C-methylase UbiE
MLAVAEGRAADAGAVIRFVAGDAHALDFPDRSFDTAVSLRVLMHTPEWRRCLAELCRVARRQVVVDYPSARSVAIIESVMRRIGRAVGIDTEAYRVLTGRVVAAELRQGGFQIRSVHRQFVLPIAFHKAVGSVRFTRAIERLFERAGVLRLFGSPVTVVAERCASS